MKNVEATQSAVLKGGEDHSVALIDPYSESEVSRHENAKNSPQHSDISLRSTATRKSKRSSVATAIASETAFLYHEVDFQMRSTVAVESSIHTVNRNSRHTFEVGSELTTDNVASNDELISIPWIMFFTNSASLALLLCHWTTSWIAFMLLNQLPTFLTDQLGYDIEAAGALSVVPYIANFVSTILFAMIFDYAEVTCLYIYMCETASFI